MPVSALSSAIEGMDSLDTWPLVAAPLAGLLLIAATVITTILSS